MSYTPSSTTYYSSTPPIPPPKPSHAATPSQGPPLPPPPPQTEPSELEGSASHHPQNQPQPQPPPRPQPTPNQPKLPPIEPGWLPASIKEKPTSDLQTLLNDPDLQNALLANPQTTHPALLASQDHLKPLLTANTNLTNHLLALEDELRVHREKTQSRLLALRALEQSHRAKISETEDALAQFSPMALYQRLSGSVTEQEGLVRGVEESWLEEGGQASEREVEGWLRRVKEVKKVGVLRRERKGRWDEGRVGGWR